MEQLLNTIFKPLKFTFIFFMKLSSIRMITWIEEKALFQQAKIVLSEIKNIFKDERTDLNPFA